MAEEISELSAELASAASAAVVKAAVFAGSASTAAAAMTPRITGSVALRTAFFSVAIFSATVPTSSGPTMDATSIG